MDDFNFSFSVSVKPYDRNLDVDKTKFLRWRETKGTINDLCNYIKNNFAFCHCYHHLDDTFANGLKTEINFNQTNLICFDLDAVRLKANELFDEMKNTAICPNIVYTTANNGHFKEGKNELYCNRYRAIYVVDEPIINPNLYTEIHQTLKGIISDFVRDKNVWNDNSDNNVSHFFAGSLNSEMYTNYNVFSLDGLISRLNIKTANKSDSHNTKKGKKKTTERNERRERDGKYISYLITNKEKSILRKDNIEKKKKRIL